MLKIAAEELSAKINLLRKKDAMAFQTNYFLNKLDNEILYLQNDNALVFLQPDRDIFRLYFAFVSLEKFEDLLKQLPCNIKISLEIITKKDLPQNIFDCINKYLPYDTTFVRSRCDISKLRTFRQYDEIEIQHAQPQDLTFIEKHLNSTFNHYSSHLPDNTELALLIENKQIIITKDADISSFIIYKTVNNNVNFDQWISLKKDAQNSMKIIDCFYNKIKKLNYNQIYLWVDFDHNKGVQNFHKYYGYKPDGVKDVFFINELLRNSSK